MKNHTHPDFKGARRNRKDPMALSSRSKEMTRKGRGKRASSPGGSAAHNKFFGH